MPIDADKVIELLTESWNGFSLKQTLWEVERVIIKKALEDAGNRSGAAHLLGFSHHHQLIAILNSRHVELMREMNIKPNRRTIFGTRRKRGQRPVSRAGREMDGDRRTHGQWHKEAL